VCDGCNYGSKGQAEGGSDHLEEFRNKRGGLEDRRGRGPLPVLEGGGTDNRLRSRLECRVRVVDKLE
jgi:hypothetical protein